MQNKIVEIENLSFSYNKDEVLKDIYLNVYEGDFLAIIGPNGGGKSTLVNIMLGLLKPKSGTLKIFSDAPESADKIGYVPQNTNINTDFPIKVIDVVLMGQKSNKRFFGYDENSRKKAMELLEKVGMSGYENAKIGSLSGGQRQRVMIARALSLDPALVIFDEPTSSIDVDGQTQIYELLRELNKKVTVIVVTHDISVIVKYASKVAHINKKLSFHDISKMQSAFSVNSSEHFCEVELLEMLKDNKCLTC